MSDYLVLDVGGSAIKHALADDQYRLWDEGSVPMDFTTHEEFVEAVGRIYDPHTNQVAGIAISSAGELDPRSGHMFSGGHLTFNAGTNMIASISSRCPGVPVSVENDANCALLAEVQDGVLQGCRNALALVLGTGVGGAVLIDGRIYHGSHFHSGNASYVLTNLDDPRQARPFAFIGGARGLVNPYTERAGLAEGSVDGRTFFQRLDEGDPAAEQTLDAFSASLAAFIYNTHVILDVETVAIGGGISAAPPLLPAIDEKLTRLFEATKFGNLPRPNLATCRHLNDANLVGALYHHQHPMV